MTTQPTTTPKIRIRKRVPIRPQARHSQHPEVVLTSPAELRCYENNARLHSAKQIGQIKRSIETFGFINPVIVGPGNEVIAGHGRLAAAMALGLDHVPVIEVSHLSAAEVRAYRLADNKLAENSTWCLTSAPMGQI